MAEKADDGTKIKLKNVRISFANVYKAQVPKPDADGKVGAASFNASFLIPKGDTENLGKCKTASKAAKTKEWGADEKKWPKLKPEKLFLRDGDLEEYDGYSGMYYASSRNPTKPVLIDRIKGPDGKWKESPEGQIYSGCYVNAILRVWVQDNEHGKRVNASLESVQFLRHGESFGAKRVDADEEFDEDDVEGVDEGGDAGDDEEDLV